MTLEPRPLKDLRQVQGEIGEEGWGIRFAEDTGSFEELTSQHVLLQDAGFIVNKPVLSNPAEGVMLHLRLAVQIFTARR